MQVFSLFTVESDRSGVQNVTRFINSNFYCFSFEFFSFTMFGIRFFSHFYLSVMVLYISPKSFISHDFSMNFKSAFLAIIASVSKSSLYILLIKDTMSSSILSLLTDWDETDSDLVLWILRKYPVLGSRLSDDSPKGQLDGVALNIAYTYLSENAF